MSDDLWEKRADKFDRHPILQSTKWIVMAIAAVVVVGCVVSACIWGGGVFTAPFRGKGDAFKQKESAQNWTQAQAQFHQIYNQITAFDSQIGDAKKAVDDFEAKHPSIGNGTPYDPTAEQDANLHRTLTGLTQQCQNTVANYDTLAQSYLSQDFRDAGLPAFIGPTDHCQVPVSITPGR